MIKEKGKCAKMENNHAMILGSGKSTEMANNFPPMDAFRMIFPQNNLVDQ